MFRRSPSSKSHCALGGTLPLQGPHFTAGTPCRRKNWCRTSICKSPDTRGLQNACPPYYPRAGIVNFFYVANGFRRETQAASRRLSGRVLRVRSCVLILLQNLVGDNCRKLILSIMPYNARATAAYTFLIPPVGCIFQKQGGLSAESNITPDPYFD